MEEVTVKLLKPHTHRGIDLQPGAKLDLPKNKAEWLIGLGVAEKSGIAIPTYVVGGNKDRESSRSKRKRG